jgi:site-specific DNA recombinase
LNTFPRKEPTSLTEYDKPLVRRLIEKVTVKDKLNVDFKSGVAVDGNA